MSASIPMLAGTISTAIFVGSTLPMLIKAARTRDLSSYSFANIGLANIGNIIYAVYVFHLPAGPIWALHSFSLLSSLAMLVWYVRYQLLPIRCAARAARYPKSRPSHTEATSSMVVSPTI